MPTSDFLRALTTEAGAHVTNTADNLQLLADLGYGYATLAVVAGDGSLVVAADARPSTAMSPFDTSRMGAGLARCRESEAYEAVERGCRVAGSRVRLARGTEYTTVAYPIGAPRPYAVVLRDITSQIMASPGRMERAFMGAAEDLLTVLRAGPLLDVRSHEPFATSRRPGDGVLRVDHNGRVRYASPNAVSIMRLAGVDERVTSLKASTLPGGALGISPILGARGTIAVEAEVAERVLDYRTMSLPDGALVLVEDLTEARRREHEVRVKETTIREVHHRVKNNLQTVASLLRIQARRSDSVEVKRALAEATERVWSMAVVHQLLSSSAEEMVDLAAVARSVVDHVRRGAVGSASQISLEVVGETGMVDGRAATSLALALVELVHNALEHAYQTSSEGTIDVVLERGSNSLTVSVHDDGCGLPAGFDPSSSGGLGLTIVKAVVEDDLGGTLSAESTAGTTVTLRVPVPPVRQAERSDDEGGY